MIDLHCHLDLYPDPAAIISGCEERGMYVLAVTTTPLAWDGNLALVKGKSRIRISPGLHPQLVPERHAELSLLLELLPSSRYVGEVGLDGGPDLKRYLPLQDSIFRSTLSEAERLGGRVISIHSRRATSQVLDALEAHPEVGVPILHWFSGSQSELIRAIQLGCWFSIGPGMLSSKKGKLLAQKMPVDKIITETDGPFVKNNGHSLNPWDVAIAEEILADCLSISQSQIRSHIVDNFRALSRAAESFPVVDPRELE